MDPLDVIFPELHEIIFQHFSVRELKNLTLVSKSWHNKIVNSKSSDRFVFSVYERNQEDLNQTLKILMGSEREYKNVSINLNNFAFNDSFEDCPHLTFKTVRYSYGILPKSLSPLTCIEDCVKVIELTKMVCETEKINFDMKFEKLEKLTLYCNYGSVNLIFKNCKNLKYLCFTQQNNSDSNELIKVLLKNNELLESLRLNLKDGESVKEVMKDCKFQLKNVVFRCDEGMLRGLRETLREIIVTQLNSIRELVINQWCGLDVLQAIFCIKRLRFTSLNLNHGDEYIFDFNLQLNGSLTHINIDDVKVDSLLLQKVIKAVPNLRFYKTVLMHYDDMIEIEKNCKNLQELYAENFYVEKIPNFGFLKNLKAFKTMDIDDVLSKSLRAKSAKERSHFENLIYFSYFTYLINNSS